MLVVVHAWVPPSGEIADRRYPSACLRQAWTEAAAGRLDAHIQVAFGGTPAGVDLRPVTVRGEAGQLLVALADRADDLLIVGTGRRGTVARLRHGHVTRFCLAHAQCPVLAVPPATPSASAFRPGSRRWERAARQELTGSTARGNVT